MDLWSWLCKMKYASKVNDKELISLDGIRSDFIILNTAWKNIPLIQNNSFWETWDGYSIGFILGGCLEKMSKIYKRATLSRFQGHSL